MNVPLLRKTLEHATDHPEEHDQSEWIRRTTCGTTCCLAARAALLTGHPPWWRSSLYDENCTALCVDRDGSLSVIADVAQRELGLSDAQAVAMFAASRTLDDLWELAEHYTHGEITRPGWGGS